MLFSQLTPCSSSSHRLILPHLRSFSCPKPTIFLNTSFCVCRAVGTGNDQPVTRRTANYQPNLWDYNYIQSLTNGFDEKKYEEEYEEMKEYVKGLIKVNQVNPLVKLELIDAVQRLGLQYLFEAEIKHALGVINKRADDSRFSSGLNATSLRFRLLRQHGYGVSQDVFKCFMDETGNLKESVYEDVEGLLSVYEASFHGLKGESMIDKVMELSCTYLKAVDKRKLPERLALKVDHALDMPIHWRPNRLEARWFIDVYEEEHGMNPTLLKLAKLDYNLVQSTYMKEVRELARWDITGIDKLPHEIRTCFLVLYNTTNEIGHWLMIERSIDAIPYLRKAWADQCKAYLVEAKWYHKGLKPPSLEEYLNIAVTTIGGMLLLLCCYLATADTLTEETLGLISRMPRIVHSSSLITRLNNDLATSSHELARGDNLKSVECYMNETGDSEQVAREHVRDLIREAWKTMNEEVSGSHHLLPGTFLDACLNLARASQCFYQYGDGHAIADRETKDHILSILINPVPME